MSRFIGGRAAELFQSVRKYFPVECKHRQFERFNAVVKERVFPVEEQIGRAVIQFQFVKGFLYLNRLWNPKT